MARHGRHGAPRAAVRAPSAPATGPFGFLRDTKHKSRNTSHGLYRRPVAVFLRVVAWLWSGCGACGAAMAMARHGRPWSGMGGILPPRQRPCPVSLSRSPSGQPPLPRTPNEPMLKKENILHGAISGAFYIASKSNLHFSPRGEAKCVRGPSGRGTSRLARAGVLEQYVEHGKQAQRSPGGSIACFDRRVVRHAG